MTFQRRGEARRRFLPPVFFFFFFPVPTSVCSDFFQAKIKSRRRERLPNYFASTPLLRSITAPPFFVEGGSLGNSVGGCLLYEATGLRAFLRSLARAQSSLRNVPTIPTCQNRCHDPNKRSFSFFFQRTVLRTIFNVLRIEVALLAVLRAITRKSLR